MKHLQQIEIIMMDYKIQVFNITNLYKQHREHGQYKMILEFNVIWLKLIQIHQLITLQMHNCLDVRMKLLDLKKNLNLN